MTQWPLRRSNQVSNGNARGNTKRFKETVHLSSSKIFFGIIAHRLPVTTNKQISDGCHEMLSHSYVLHQICTAALWNHVCLNKKKSCAEQISSKVAPFILTCDLDHGRKLISQIHLLYTVTCFIEVRMTTYTFGISLHLSGSLINVPTS